jgi:hypothetical protein
VSPGTKSEVRAGDAMDFYVARYEDKDGAIVLSRERAHRVTCRGASLMRPVPARTKALRFARRAYPLCPHRRPLMPSVGAINAILRGGRDRIPSPAKSRSAEEATDQAGQHMRFPPATLLGPLAWECANAIAVHYPRVATEASQTILKPSVV